MTNDVAIVKEGSTMDYLLPGFIVLAVLAVTGFITELHFLIFVGLVLGIIIMTLPFGIQIDLKKKRIRSYFSVVGIKIGKWTDLREVAKVTLGYELKTGKTSGVWVEIAAPSMTNSSRKSTVKCYELYFTDHIGHEIKFHQFVRMKPAFETIWILEKQMGLEADNQIISMQSILGKGRKR